MNSCGKDTTLESFLKLLKDEPAREIVWPTDLAIGWMDKNTLEKEGPTSAPKKTIWNYAAAT